MAMLFRKRISVVVLAALMGVVMTSTAQAQPLSPLDRCRAGVGGNFNTNLVVDQNPAVFGFRAEIWPGDVLRVTATGGIKIDSWPWTGNTSPDGTNAPAPNGWPAPGKRQFSLVGVFNDTGGTVQLGAESGCFVYTGSPRTFLWLRVNDPYTGDNSGRWDVVIRQFF